MQRNKDMDQKQKTIAVIGLGLIGGSFARAFKKYTDYTVIGFNRTRSTAELALEQGVIDAIGTDDNLREADVVLLSLYPKASCDFVEQHIEHFRPGCIITDDCGIKEYLVDRLTDLCRAHGLYYVGGHPMAGREVSGYKASHADLYKGASMLLVPTAASTPEIVQRVKDMFAKIGFSQLVVTTPEHHDRMIAYTSQLCHVISSAYIKSPSEMEHKGYSGGSYRDLTRVAYLNETMWTELFIENRRALVPEIDEVIRHLTEYRDAIEQEDADTLFRLLRDGKRRKEQFG